MNVTFVGGMVLAYAARENNWPISGWWMIALGVVPFWLGEWYFNRFDEENKNKWLIKSILQKNKTK